MPLKRLAYLSKEALEKYVNFDEFNKTADNTIDAITYNKNASENVCVVVPFLPRPHPVPSTSRVSPQVSYTVIDCIKRLPCMQ